MNVLDDDSEHFLGVGKKRDRIDTVLEEFQYLTAGPDSHQPKTRQKSVSI